MEDKMNVAVEIKRGASPLGIAALVMGIIACLFCWIPFLGLLAIPLALIGILLAFAGFIMAIVNKKTGFVFPISGGLVCLLSVFIAFAITGGCANIVSETVKKGERTNQTVVPTNPVQGLVPGSLLKTENQPPLPPAVEWTKASNAVQQGDVQVQIKVLKVGKALLKDIFGDSQESTDDLLVITLDISNISTGKKINFSTWQGEDFNFGRDFASLTDDNSNVYKRINFGPTSRPVGGVDKESIYPGKVVTDLLVFEKPVDTVKWLHLELPAENFGGDGMIRFEIPASMIGR
ncbi:MAG: hypothetical protein V1933_08365 [Candidatus Omnitrophota bacterium]